MSNDEKEQLLNLINWVSENCSINVREELRDVGVNPDGLYKLIQAVEGVKTNSFNRCF